MNSASNHISIWLLVIVLVGLAACTGQEVTRDDSELTAVEATSEVITTAEPTATATLTTPTATATAVLPTPTATATEAPPTVAPTSTPVPVALCPGEAEPELTWSCEENSRDGMRYCTAVDLEQPLACFEDLDPLVFPNPNVIWG